MRNIVMIKAHSIHIAIAIPVPTSPAPIYSTSKNVEKCFGSMLGTIHNLRYYLRLTEAMRDALDNGTFDEFVHDFYARRGLEVPPCPQD